MDPGLTNPESAAILAPGRDGEAVAAMLREHGMGSVAWPNFPSFLAAFGRQCGFAVVMQDALTGPDLDRLAEKVRGQPDWSDMPFVVLTERSDIPEQTPAALAIMERLGNVTFLERPFHPTTVVSLARTALASRRRQYQARDRLLALEHSRAELQRSDERLKFALAVGKLGSWELDFPGRALRASEQCKVNFGLAPDEDLTYEGLLAIIHDEDRDQVVAAAQRAIDARTDFEVDCRFVSSSSDVRWVEIRGRATYDRGQAERLVGVSLDVTHRKLGEERQNLLIRELHHRVKNTLATVQAIVGSTARGASSVDDFHRDFTGRIMSLANTHNLLTEEFWQRARLDELVGKELDMFEEGHERIRICGPAIDLPSEFAVPLGMAFHELMTNAAKYGALSDGAGRVDVDWSLEDDGPSPVIRLSWIEQGGPAVAPPTRKGFGTRLLERVLTAQLRADVEIDYAPGGLRVLVNFPMPVHRPPEPVADAAG